ncbi:intermembrane lipid transfer protein Vps13 isoform X2 [Diorhabda carinulata]|uniref:intermembrane lipid transfer protein Vps13 isoform X2 n=1 Tax=Diorhabda carinulata TaxID=1163345 RepID=UPI0025A1329D|nr:intermembrane lipid transfer protein Vps13 isoform X2 [Diorhabda carinulata]
MVFQSVLSYVLNKYLGEFVENLDENQLNVGIWGGDVELKDLVLKPAALAELDLPVQSVYGKIGKLVLKIPWKSLYTSSTIITVEDIYLLVQPNQQVKFDPVKEERRLYDFKLKEIHRIEEAKRLEEEKLAGKAPAKSGWTQEFAEKLVASIIKNIQLNIKHIHIRYEDKVTNSKFPFAFGVTLDQLIVESTDSNWKKTISDDIVKIYKILYLESLSVYLNCKTSLYGDLPVVQMLKKLELGIATKSHMPEGFTYILGPINSSARLIMNQKPELDDPSYSIPKFHFNLQMETLYVGINKCQYRDIISLVDSMGRMTKGLPYRKYRPNITEYKGHYHEWWKFAITAVLEGDVRRKRRDWNWDHILNYRQMCKEYHTLFTAKQQKKQLKPDETDRLITCEKTLDLTNLIIIRQQVKAEAVKEAQTQGKQSWWDWAWGSKSKGSIDSSKIDIIDQFKKEMTPEEKENLYKAIGYQENAAPTEYPEEYVDLSCAFLLKSLIVELSDITREESFIRVLKIDLNTVRCKLETRPAASAVKVQVKVDDLTGEGYHQEDFIPYLIISETKNRQGLLEVLFEKNPLDKTCDQRIHVTALPLKIVYDATTINRAVKIFEIPPDSNLEQITDVAAHKLTDIKEMSSLGLQYAVEKRPLIDLNIDLQAPLLILPYGGKYTGSENVLLANLGRVKIFSFGQRISSEKVKLLSDEGKSKTEILEYMQKNCYDNFKLELTNVQILAAQSDENWKEALVTGISKMHLLKPVSVSVTFSSCIITDDPSLPLNKINGVIPSIDVVVSDARLLLLVDLVTSIQFPGGDIPETQPLKKAASSTLLLKYKEMQATGKQTKQLIDNLEHHESNVQFITLQAEFEMSKVSLLVIHQVTTVSEKQLATFRVDSIKCNLQQQTYVTNISMMLGGVELVMDRGFEKIKIIETPIGKNEKNHSLFKVHFIQVDPKYCDFHSTYKSCESSLLLDFDVLNIILHQEGLLSLMNFATDIQNQIAASTTEKQNSLQDRIATTQDDFGFVSKLASIGEEFVEIPAKEIKKRSKKKKKMVETIKIKINSALKEVSVKFCSDTTDISSVAISGANATVIVKDNYTQVNATLQDITVLDLNHKSVHKLIMSRLDGETITAQVVLNNNEDTESDLPDIDVKVQLGRSRIVFMNWFVSNMLNFLNQFQSAQEAVVEASHRAAEAAKENMKEVYDKATKIALNIVVKAPIIMVPINSHSYDSLLLDMGIITLENKFLTLDVKNEEDNPAVIDDLKIGFKELKVSRVLLDQHYSLLQEHIMLNPFNFNLTVKRNLSTSWYTSIPDIDLSGNIASIHIMMGNIDYQRIMAILSGNLSEGKVEVTNKEFEEEVKEEVLNTVTPQTEHVEIEHADVATEALTKIKPHVFLKFTFTMEKFIISLYHNADKVETEGLFCVDKNHQFAKFSLEGLSLKGRILTDGSLVTSILLMNCLMDDKRPGREDKLNRMIDRSSKNESYEFVDASSAPKSMIDVTFQQKDNAMFADVRVFSFNIILSMEFLMKLADFFKLPEHENEIGTSHENTVSHMSKQNSGLSTKSHGYAMKTKSKAKSTTNDVQMTVNVKLEKPDIVLVEHMDSIDTRALILNAEILLKYRAAGTHQVVNGIIKELELYRCVYNPAQRSQTRSNVLHPLDISLAGSTPPEKGLHLELLITNVYLSVSPATIELLNKALATMTADASKINKEEEHIYNYENLWKDQEFTEDRFWFLNTEFGTDVLVLDNLMEMDKPVLQELCIISIPSITVTIEAGVGTKTLPLLMLETGFTGSVRNWSSQLNMEAVLTMQMGYYNSKLALWEPLIEPEVVNNKHIPWELKLGVTMNNESTNGDSSSTLSPTESEIEKTEIEIPQALMEIDLESEKNLEITVTKTLLENLQYLGKAFASALDTEKIKFQTYVPPFKVLNELGEDITLLLEESSFVGVASGVGDVNKLEAVPLELKEDYKMNEKLHLGKELLASNNKKSLILKVQISDLDSTFTLPVNRADKRYFPLNYRSSIHDNWGLISDIRVDEAVTIITLRSIVQVHNHFNEYIDVYYMTSKGNQLELVNTVKPNEKLNVPLKAVYTPTTELFFAVSNYSVTVSPFTWKDLQTNLKVTRILQSFPKIQERENIPFVIKVVGEMEQVYYENTNRHTMASTCFNIHLRPAVIFKNGLPYNVICCVDESPDEFVVEPGDTLQLPTVDPGKNSLVFRIPDYLEKEWSCRKPLAGDPDEFSVWTFESFDSSTKMSLELGMYIVKRNESLELTLYCPFWMLNKTGLMLGYRYLFHISNCCVQSGDENLNILYHPSDFKGPILFSFNAKNFFGKKKASVRVENGDWSNKFSVDVAGSSGFVNCKWNEQIYQIGVQNRLTHNGLTKQITFTPYYIIINEATYEIECQEHNRPADHWVVVEPKSCAALWPKSEAQDKLMRLRVKGTTESSAPFLYTESHNTLLRLNNKYGGVNVDIQLTEGAVYINLAAYQDGCAPALLVNHSTYPISYWEKEAVQKRTLAPFAYCLYTWENPSGPRAIAWDRGNNKEIINDLRKDMYGQFSPKDEIFISWASFLDGMQRVLLFTEDNQLAEGAQASNILEVIQQDITVSIHGIGLSLVNNATRQELMYLGIASSGVIWESSKMNNNRFKFLDPKQSMQLENAYQQCLQESEVNPKVSWHVHIDGKTEVDFKNNMMYKPHKKRIRRTFITGLWFNMKTSPSQMQIHAKINRLQIDNQLYDCIFPVILAPVPPPKSVTVNDGIKPFIEVSIVQLLMKNSQIRQFKYFKVLVQEFHIKLDMGFVNSILEMMQEDEASAETEKQQFLIDKQQVEETLYALASNQAIQEQKSFYDLLHFSPLKIHISFSLAAGTSSSSQNISTPPIVNALLQGIGVTLTDLNDVVFKLAFFERNFTFLTQKQLINEAASHYAGQAIKQFYVLVLGLDVLGNPYGLVLGITKGVEDLFYEPFQGAIQGPGEFVEGLALGVKSLFGHTVGGAAGAVSKITGAMGKGIAALTLDDDFQRKRREKMNRKPQNVQEGLARSGKGLVMGVYSGVTGVFTKPVEGAREEGVEGFFKGLGKGAVGLVTRPVAGVVDFASDSLDVVKRAAEGNEDTLRLRAPRFLHSDGLVRPYNQHEANGNRYLNHVSKGKYAKTDTYVAHYIIIQNKEVLLLTDRRVAYITHNDIFGGWQIDWSYTWEEVTMPAKVTPKGILIATSEKKKKLFGSNSNSKIILVSSSQTREEICEKIESLRSV